VAVKAVVAEQEWAFDLGIFLLQAFSNFLLAVTCGRHDLFTLIIIKAIFQDIVHFLICVCLRVRTTQHPT